MSENPETSEIEQHRQELLQQLEADAEQNARGNYAPGSFGCHELLDRTALLMRLLEEEVVEHPACIQQPQWFALAYDATEVLNRLYQEIGRAHLTDEAG